MSVRLLADDPNEIIPVVVSGAATNQGATDDQNAGSDRTEPGVYSELNLAKLRTQARVVYTSSGAINLSRRLIDSDSRSCFQFEGTDLHPTVIVELALNVGIHRVSATFPETEGTTVKSYLFNALPENREDMSRGLPLTCNVRTDKGVSIATAEFTTTTARFVAFRWTRTQASHRPFPVAEVDAFTFDGPPRLEFGPDLAVVADAAVLPPLIRVVSP